MAEPIEIRSNPSPTNSLHITAVGSSSSAVSSNPPSPEKGSPGRRGFKRLAMLDGYLKGLQSSKELHDNIASGKLYLVHRQLLNAANVDGVNEDGDSLLNVAINCGKLDVFHLLLKHGADPNKRSKPKQKIHGLCENSPMWKTIRFRDLRWCELLMEAGYNPTKDQEKEGWVDALRRHLQDIEKKKKEEGIDLTQDPFNVTYSNFFQWFDDVGHDTASSLSDQCRSVIRKTLLKASQNKSIYKQAESLPVPKILRNFLLIQDNETEDWLDDYKKNKAKAFEKMFVFYDECVAAERGECGVSDTHQGKKRARI